MNIAGALLTIAPWVFTAVTLLTAGLLGWKIGLPAVKILQLEQRIKLLDLQFQTALEKAELAEKRADHLEDQLKRALDELHTANMRLASLLTVIELKKDLPPGTTLPVGTTQTVVTKVEKTEEKA